MNQKTISSYFMNTLLRKTRSDKKGKKYKFREWVHSLTIKLFRKIFDLSSYLCSYLIDIYIYILGL